MNRYELSEKIICDYLIAPLVIFGIIITFAFWLIMVGLIWPLTQLSFFIHSAEKKFLRHQQEDLDTELDEAIEKIQMKSIKESKPDDI